MDVALQQRHRHVLRRPGLRLGRLHRRQRARDSNGQSWILYDIVWIIGILWYFFWKQRSNSVGVDVLMTYGELPPEYVSHVLPPSVL